MKLPLACIIATIAGLALSPATAQTIVEGDTIIIVPQGRRSAIWPHPRPRPPQSVQLTSVNTSVSITDQVASTTLVMTVTNPGGGQQEAQFLVPVPDGASVRAFQLDGLGPEPTAKIMPRDEARRIYDAIVSSSRDPGLLEFVGYGLIKSSVFPVPPGGTQTVRLTYEQLLPAEGSNKADRVDFVMPRTESLEATGVTWTFSADIRSKRPISTVYSPSHEIVTERIDPNHITVKLMTSAPAQPGSFRLSYLMPKNGDDLAASVLFYPDPEVGDGKGGYFLLLTGLPAKPQDAERTQKREVTIVMDRSGSMRGQKIVQAREAVLQVVEGLLPGESFNIIDYSDSINSFAERPVVKNDETMTRARAYIAAIQANGGTNIHDAVVEALRQEPTQGTLPVVLFLTDGLPTVGQTAEKTIRDAAAKANTFHRRIFTFGVGYDVNAPLLRGLAIGSRATSTFVLPEENVEVKVGQVYRRLSGPVLAAPKISTTQEEDGPRLGLKPIRELQPGALPDLFEGDQLIVLGQYTDPTARSITLEGNFLGRQRTFEFSFDPAKASTRNAFVPRLWATRRIAQLIEQVRQSAADDNIADPKRDSRTKELVDEVVRLSTTWGILTEYTAFLALEPGTVLAGAPGAELREALTSVTGGASTGRSALNLDVLSKPEAPAESAPAAAKAAWIVNERAGKDRDGKIAVNQELNLARQLEVGCVNPSNAFFDKDMNQVQIATICQVGDQTLFRRSNRWVDARLVDAAEQEPQLTIEFGTAAYSKLVDDLAAQGRVGLIAQGGDCLLLHQGQRVLVKGPTEPAR